MGLTSSPWNVVWITGASSGIGRDLALKLADAGARVAASARSADTLAELSAEKSNIVPVPVDVTDLGAMRQAAAIIRDTIGPVDLAILNAGVWHEMGARELDTDALLQSMDVNYYGIIHALDPVLPDMLQRGSGHIAMVSSVAGYRGLPNSTAYAPTKAAVISLAECLRHGLAHTPVKVSVINPGFVDTPMTHVNEFPMPFIITSDDAANRMIKGLAKGKYEIAFPWQTNFMMKLARFTPNWLFFWLVRTFMVPRK